MLKKFKYKCVGAHVSISIYTPELEKNSSVAAMNFPKRGSSLVAVTFTLFANSQLTFSPVKYPYSVLRRLL